MTIVGDLHSLRNMLLSLISESSVFLIDNIGEYISAFFVQLLC